jgi:hypothetical protein
MFAEMCSPEQAASLVRHLEDPQVFGGSRPWVSVARNDPGYIAEHGDYWKGGIWLPIVYMGTRALEKYGYHREAARVTGNVLRQMLNTYREYHPHTIWESYSPSSDKPASYKDGKEPVRPDFCGWSALGPISLLIETLLGFHTVDADQNRVRWRLHQPGKHGITNLRFGNIVTDIVYDGQHSVTVRSNAPYTLEINGSPYAVPAGRVVLDPVKPQS